MKIEFVNATTEVVMIGVVIIAFLLLLMRNTILFSKEPDESTEKIKQAKEFFWSMGCSHFHMAREYPDKYKEYKRLIEF